MRGQRQQSTAGRGSKTVAVAYRSSARDDTPTAPGEKTIFHQVPATKDTKGPWLAARRDGQVHGRRPAHRVLLRDVQEHGWTEAVGPRPLSHVRRHLGWDAGLDEL